ncbi:transposase [Allgaiera indica]|uniref:Transposase n=1 Tax=Allgaiera indica TaxID=765699 RepID=A0AAN4UVT4_9RHOB|nr:Mu transposase C-terminal domain-containing protein [Allgaiera indica]GHE06452.1 transposase [Allgaiera indica]SDX92886.1 putative transposase [Allgaiera indica]
MARSTSKPKAGSLSGEDRPTDEAWSKAVRIAAELDQVLASTEPKHLAINRAARELKLSSRQIYNHLARYREERRVSSLLRRTSPQRQPRLSERVEGIIAETLRELWRTKEQPDLAPIVDEIRARCAQQNLAPPSYFSVAKRIPRLFTPEEIARRRQSNSKHLRRLKPRPGYIRADHPLDVVQIDHTPADINFIEVIDGEGVFVGRPYLTIAADVATKAIIGLCLTLERPSTLSVALCLAHALCDKKTWLQDRGIDHAWPMQGRPKVVVVDSAKEFKGNSFSRGCADYGITIKPRNKGTVHHGGVVERLLGKVNTILRSLPGKTGRSVADRDEYPSEEKARLTFAELERCIALAVIDHNKSQNERSLTVPDDEWKNRHQVMDGLKDDPVNVLLNFLPRAERQITPQGVSLFAVDYFEPWLGPLVARRDRLLPLELCYDPRNISRIYVKDPDTKAWRPVARRDGLKAPVTLWQHREERHRLRERGRRDPVERVSIRREIAETAKKAKTDKKRLRELTRARHAEAATKPHEGPGTETRPKPQGPDPNRSRRIFPIEDW